MSRVQKGQGKQRNIELSSPNLSSKSIAAPNRASTAEKTALLSSPGTTARNYVLPAPKLEVYQKKIAEKKDIEKGLEESSDEEEISDGNFLGIIFVIYVLVALMNRLFQKLQTIPMYNYPMFLNLLTTFAYVPFSFAYIIPMVHYGKAITKQQLQIPKYKFAVMGTLDCLSSIMAMFAVNYIANASTIVLIQQSAIPISMAFSKLTLGAVYSGSQYLGAFVVCLGIFVVLWPSMSGNSADEDNGHNQALWAAVMMLSCIPNAVSSVYKESALQGEDIDVVYLNGWVALFQFLLCIPLAYPSAMAISLPISELPTNMMDGMWCFLGINSITADDVMNDGGTMKVDQCGMAPIYVSLYIMFNMAYNILVIVILKYGSANIMFLGSTALVPMTNALFAMDWIPGHKPLQITDWIGLIVIMAGITVYRFMTKMPCSQFNIAEEDEVKSTVKTQRKSALYVGLNASMETVQPLLEVRARRAMKRLRIPERPHTRSPFYSKLGIAPSPRMGKSPGASPGPPRRSPMSQPRKPETKL